MFCRIEIVEKIFDCDIYLCWSVNDDVYDNNSFYKF